MRIVHLGVSDKGNGAHLAGYRLHKALQGVGVDSAMFVQHRLGDSGDNTIQEYRRPANLSFRLKTRAYRHWISRDLARYPKRPDNRSLIFDRATEGPQVIAQVPPADVIYIHSMYNFIDYLDLPHLARRAPIIILLHDMAPFTGGCPYAYECMGFTSRCGTCPVLQSHTENDSSRRIWERKHSVYSRISDRLHFVAASRWIAREASKSSLLKDFPIQVIPNSVDTEVFQPQDRNAMRRLLGIPTDGCVIGFVSEPLGRAEKGLPFLTKTLDGMKDTHDLFLVTAGGGRPPVDAGIPHKHLGRLFDSRSLSAFYSAADIVAIPSVEDNLPNVAMEAMACGTPVVAFATGGIPEMVRGGVTGLVVPKADIGALRAGIAELLHDSSTRARMGENARKVAVEEYSMEVVAKRHGDYCAKIMSSPISEVRPGCDEEPHKLVGKA